MTDREYEVVRELAQPGETMKSVAHRLGISDETGWERLDRGDKKLGLPSRKYMTTEAVYALIRNRRRACGRAV